MVTITNTKMNTPLNILIVEDSEDDTFLLLRALRDGGYEPFYERVDTKESLDEALARHKWDVIISDYVMPKFSGLAAMEMVMEKGLDLPFIIVSGNIGEDIAVAALKAGANDYIIKGNLIRLAPAIERELRDAEIRRERRRTEEALYESEARYKALFENSLDAVFLLSPSGRILAANQATCAMLNMTEPEILNANEAVFIELSDPNFIEYLDKRQHSGKARAETTCLRKGGAKFPCELASSVFVDGNNKRFISVIARDVTERKLAEARISRLNHLYSVLSKVNETIVRIHDPNKLFESVCRIVVEVGLFKMAWIGVADPEMHKVRPVAGWGDTEGYLTVLGSIDPHLPGEKGPTGEAVYGQKPVICNRIEDEPVMLPWRDLALKCGFRSASAFPLSKGSVIIGALTVYSETAGVFTDEETQLMCSLAEDISFAIDSAANEKMRVQAEETLQKSRAELRALSAHLQTAMEEERIRIAREIHDELGQILTAADMELAGVHKEFSDNRTAAEKISAVSELIGIAIEDVQRICSELRPRVLDHLGLVAALEWQADDFSRRSGISCSINTPNDKIILSAAVSTTIFRIFQETLTNAARHSGATEVRAKLSVDDKFITLKVSDNGTGISAEKLTDSESLGLIGTRERAQELGGTVRYRVADGKGTTVTAKIPLKERGIHHV